MALNDDIPKKRQFIEMLETNIEKFDDLALGINERDFIKLNNQMNTISLEENVQKRNKVELIYGWDIQKFKDPSEEQVLLAIDLHVEAIQYIPNPTYKIQRYAVSKWAFAIKWIKDP